jgi:hypothetical protein
MIPVGKWLHKGWLQCDIFSNFKLLMHVVKQISMFVVMTAEAACLSSLKLLPKVKVGLQAVICFNALEGTYYPKGALKRIYFELRNFSTGKFFRLPTRLFLNK